MSGFDDANFPDWDLDEPVRPPASIRPEPAIGQTDLRGRRVLVGLPGVGWRSDLRADRPVVQGSRTYVPVLPEYEWYRAESEQTEVFAPLVPIERVWVETLGVSTSDGEANRGHDILAKLVSLDAPPRRDPVAVGAASKVTGQRVVHMVLPEDQAPTERRDLRAVTEPYGSAEGDICVRVAAELDWYRWAWAGRPPSTLAVPIHLLWLE
ncbi:MAG TPA: hypothetical protein VK453_20705 [Micromonosporaceae bacterium]|nr:hypothetical protein [Micromonosporaceae bacterium]